MKSLWFLVYDIVSIDSHYRLESIGSLCQASGFFFSVGIEAADASVFLIALHSTVYIFWPNRAGGESGLYPYRRMAYLFYAMFPVLMASLAFVKGVPAYVNSGQSCYLPTTPWWYRTTLSWIPRYLILLTILIMYGSSYTYVRVMMRRYSRRSSDTPVGRPARLVPLTPPLSTHGLFPSPPGSSKRAQSNLFPGGPLSRDLSPLPLDGPPELGNPIRLRLSDRLHPGTRMKENWSWTGFEADSDAGPTSVSPPAVSPMGMLSPTTEPSEPVWEDPEAPTPLQSPQFALFKHQALIEPGSSTLENPVRGRSVPDVYRRAVVNAKEAPTPPAYLGPEDRGNSRLNIAALPLPLGTLGGRSKGNDHNEHLLTGSQVHICTMLSRGPVRPADGSDRGSEASWASPVALDRETFESGGISRSRDRLRRQLRLLFVYPAVYACVWVFPFVSDVSRFNSGPDGRHNAFWVLVVSLVSLCVQGLCDAVVFCSREKPWRHVRGDVCESFRLGFLRGWSWDMRKDSGRTREEMFNDSSRARSRRDEELEREHEFRGAPGGRRPATAGGNDWWDVEAGGAQEHGQVPREIKTASREAH